jgi:hypothetical protein
MRDSFGASRKVKIVSTSQTIQTVFNKIIILKIVVKSQMILTKTGVFCKTKIFVNAYLICLLSTHSLNPK